MVKSNLHLFTSSYPFGNSPERVFVEPEIEYLREAFDKVYIYSLKQSDEKCNLPGNIEVADFNVNENTLEHLSFGTKVSLLLLVFYEVIKNNKLWSLQKIKLLYSYLKQYYLKGEKLTDFWSRKKSLKEGDVLYTYWFEEWNYILSLLKKNGKISQKLVSRAHGFDLYDERSQFGKIPFRKMQLNYTDHIYSISYTGSVYLKKKFPTYSEKISVAKIGTYDNGINNRKGDIIHLVSCSSVSPVKRVELIADILREVNISLKWTHFGDGPLAGKVLKKVKKLPKNIKVDWRGFQPNENVISFYQSEPVDLFINVSASEGIPVSIMEAISFSIPVCAFNVGGISEIVNEKTGMLFQGKDDLTQVTEFINSLSGSKYLSSDFRENVRLFWEENFSAKNNHAKFVRTLKS